MAGRKKRQGEARRPMYAEEVGLRCRQYKRGTREECGKQAEYFDPTAGGEVCGEHRRSERAIRYATRPVEAKAAA